jgi:hypothetical protein
MAEYLRIPRPIFVRRAGSIGKFAWVRLPGVDRGQQYEELISSPARFTP